MHFWDGNTGTGSALLVVGDLLPGTKIALQEIQDTPNSYFVLSNQRNWSTFSDAKMMLYRSYFRLYNHLGTELQKQNTMSENAEFGKYFYIRALTSVSSSNSLYFDPINGDDEKVGTSAANALRSWDAVEKGSMFLASESSSSF